ncbi:MAG TPA: cobalamin B12-binding domain-containing protein [Nitrososphaeraceae archaeon]|jgi:MerR family transcriptional regulator, light-induced transcriptional regulator|nr:cobalamin B12-binding domain-containing protein [Nitrososphaeraceae archaeon]
MVYIRIKQVKNNGYAYLVESKWNKEKHTSQQIIKQYLGPVDQININKIPEEYRNESTIIKFLASLNIDFSKYMKLNDSLQVNLLEKLKSYEINDILKIYNDYTKSIYTLLDFYEKILIPVLYKIGDQWENGEIDVATEHVCSNAVNNLIDLINQQNTKKNLKNHRDTRSIVLSTPEGELHSIGCKIIESLLLEKGYDVYNITSPLPTNSIESYLDNTNPGVILISVTLEENINSAIRLVYEIRKSFQIPIIVGGNALKFASKSQIQQLEKYDKIYLDLEYLAEIINNVKVVLDKK